MNILFLSQLIFQVALEIMRKNADVIVNARDEGEALLALNEFTEKITDSNVNNSTQVGRFFMFLIF